MEKQRKHLGNITFESSATGGNFSDLQVQLPDLGPQLQRRRNDLYNDYEYLKQSGLRDLQLTQKRDDVRLAHNWRMSQILDASEQRFLNAASKTFFALGEKQIENKLLEQTAEGDALFYEMQPYLDTKTLKEREQYEFADQASINLQSQMAKVIGQGLANGVPVSVLRKYDELSHTGKTRYLRRFLKQEAANIPGKVLEKSQTWTGKLQPEIEASLVQSNPEFAQYVGREWNLAEDDKLISGKSYTPALRAAINAQIRQEILKDYSSIPKYAKAKYLFPELKKVQEAIDTDNAAKERNLITSEAVAESFADFDAALRGGTPGDYLRLEEDLGSVLGSRRIARNLLMKEFMEGIQSGAYSDQQIMSWYNTPFTHRGTGKETTIGEFLNDELTAAGFHQTRVDGVEKYYDLKNQEYDNANSQLEINLRDLPEGTSQGTLMQIGKLFKDKYGKFPEAINTYLNGQERDGLPLKEWLEYKRLKNGGVLTEQDLKGVPSSISKTYRDQKLVDSGNNILPSSTELTDLKAIAEASTRDYFNMEGEDKLTPEGLAFKKRAERHATELWIQSRQAGLDPIEAWERVNKLVSGAAEKGKYNNYDWQKDKKGRTKHERKIAKYEAALKHVLDTDSSTLIPGTEAEITALEKWNERGGRDPLPSLYKFLASKSGMDAWEFANNQFGAAGKGELVEPKIVEEIRKSNYTDKQLINMFPSLSKSIRFIKTNQEKVEVPENIVARLEYRNRSTGSWYFNHRNTPKNVATVDSYWNQNTIFGVA